jgi:Zn-dependent M28 family amino/carboxypeptidase
MHQKRRVRPMVLAIAALLIAGVAAGTYFTRMPGHRSSKLAPLTSAEIALRDQLRRHVEILGNEIGERNVPNYDELQRARDYIIRELTALGYQAEQQRYTAAGREVSNIVVEIPGASRAQEIVIFGAHYDSVVGTPGANDNGSGVAALLELARVSRDLRPSRNIRFVFFVNEEPPYFQTDAMGSVVYARRCHERKENIVAMFSLETMGYYSDEPNSQQYPTELAALYPHTGNFIAFASNVRSTPLLRHTAEVFSKSTTLPVEGGAAPESIPGVGWSDHWSFWKEGYAAVMVTDTAPYRYPHYHASTDTPDKLDYERLARCVTGLNGVLRDLATPQ